MPNAFRRFSRYTSTARIRLEIGVGVIFIFDAPMIPYPIFKLEANEAFLLPVGLVSTLAIAAATIAAM